MKITEIIGRMAELPDRETMIIRMAMSGEIDRDYRKEVDDELLGKPYKADMKMRELEPCERCDDTVCMGWVEVVGIDRETKVRVSYREIHDIEKHYSSPEHDAVIGKLEVVLDIR